MIDSLCDQARNREIAVACLYCDFLAQQEQTITSMMGAILKQLVGRGDIPIYLREAFQEGQKVIGGRGLLLADLMPMLRTAITSLPQVFICIDAIDECLPKNLPEFLESLRDIVRESPTTRIFLTGRLHVEGAIQRYFSKAVVIPVSPNMDDIRSYLKMKLDRDDEPEAMDNDLRTDIVEVILDKMSNMCVGEFNLSILSMYTYEKIICRFLLVSLNIDAILGEVTIGLRRKKLEEMARGNGLSDAYTATLTRMKGQKGNKSVPGFKVLKWVLYSERPLRADELCHALAVEMGSPDIDPKNIPMLRTLLSSCLGLVTVEASSSTVRLVHFTLQEHLLSNPTLFHSPHSTIAEVCLTYLNFGCIRDLSPTLKLAPPTTPLLEYASIYWGEHAKIGMTENAKILALRLLDRFDQHISAQLLLLRHLRAHWTSSYEKAGGPMGFTGLHGASFLGIVEMTGAVLEMKEWDVNATDSMGTTALIWAAVKGHEGVVKLLLEQEEVNPNQADTACGRTPLSWAAKQGHHGVVKMLLEREDVNPDHRDNCFGRTPILSAAEGGHEGTVKMLLECARVNPELSDALHGRTPLSWAAGNGHEGVVKMLLEQKEVNPDQPDTEYGRTPLSWAAQRGREEVVKMLLGREDVNPDQADAYGRMPLSWAVEYRHEGVVKMLLEREDVNPDQPDTYYGRTPISWAAGVGHEGLVKMLLEREDVNPDQPDASGGTPISWAARYGHEGVVKMLLEREEVNPYQEDTFGRTPLSRATENGRGGVVKILLERADVNPDQANTDYGRTPLWWTTNVMRR